MTLALVLLLAGTGVSQEVPDERPSSAASATGVATDERYVSSAASERVLVRADWTEPALLERLADDLVRALPVLERETGLELPPGERLVFDLFATREAFLAAVQADGGLPTAATGLTLIDTLASYVVVQPTREPAYLAAVGGMPQGLLDLVLHEAVHQLVMRAHHAPERALPAWYVEGRAEHVSALALRALLGADEPAPLCLATPTNEVALALEEANAMPLDAVLGATFPVPRTSLFYAQAGSVYAYMRAEDSPYRARFAAFEAWLSEQVTPPDDGTHAFDEPLAGLEERWRACVGPLERFERDWAAASRARAGAWHELWRHSQRVGDELVCASNDWTTFSLVLNGERPRADAFTIETRLAFLYGHSACLALGLTEDPLAFLLVELTRAGELSVSEFARDAWTPLATTRVAALEPGEWTAIAVRVSGERLEVSVDEAVAVTTSVAPGRALGAGFWGAGTQRAGVRYRGLARR